MIKSSMLETLTRIEYSAYKNKRRVEKPIIVHKPQQKPRNHEVDISNIGLNINIYI